MGRVQTQRLRPAAVGAQPPSVRRAPAGGAARRCAPQTRGCLRLRGRRPSGQTRHYLSPNACGQRAQEAPVPHPYSTPPASTGPAASRRHPASLGDLPKARSRWGHGGRDPRREPAPLAPPGPAGRVGVPAEPGRAAGPRPGRSAINPRGTLSGTESAGCSAAPGCGRAYRSVLGRRRQARAIINPAPARSPRSLGRRSSPGPRLPRSAPPPPGSRGRVRKQVLQELAPRTMRVLCE